MLKFLCSSLLILSSMFLAAIAADVDSKVIAEQEYIVDNCQLNELVNNLADDQEKTDHPLFNNHFNSPVVILNNKVEHQKFITVSSKSHSVNARSPPQII